MATTRRSTRKPVRKKKAAKRPADRRKHQPSTLRLARVQPGFTVNDLDRSLRFYRDILGFHVGDLWKQDGQVMGAEIVAGNVSIYLGQDDFKKGRDRAKGIGFRIYISTKEDVDGIAARIKANGGTLDHDPITQPWGTRDFGITDPDGFKITVGSMS